MKKTLTDWFQARLEAYRDWRTMRIHQQHIRWLRKARVVLGKGTPNPRCVVYRKWRVPL